MPLLIEELLLAFHTFTLPKEEWNHHAHLKVGLWYLLHHSPINNDNDTVKNICGFLEHDKLNGVLNQFF